MMVQCICFDFDCVDICSIVVVFVVWDFVYVSYLVWECVEICEQCVVECGCYEVGYCQECVEVCYECVEFCKVV